MLDVHNMVPTALSSGFVININPQLLTTSPDHSNDQAYAKLRPNYVVKNKYYLKEVEDIVTMYKADPKEIIKAKKIKYLLSLFNTVTSHSLLEWVYLNTNSHKMGLSNIHYDFINEVINFFYYSKVPSLSFRQYKSILMPDCDGSVSKTKQKIVNNNIIDRVSNKELFQKGLSIKTEYDNHIGLSEVISFLDVVAGNYN